VLRLTGPQLRHCSRKRSVCPFVRLLPICERYVLKKNEPILMQNGTTDGNVAIDRGGGVAHSFNRPPDGVFLTHLSFCSGCRTHRLEVSSEGSRINWVSTWTPSMGCYLNWKQRTLSRKVTKSISK